MKKDKIMTNTLFVVSIAVLCTLLWGTAFPAIKTGYELFQISTDDIASKLIFAGGRFLLAGIVVLFIGLFVNRKNIILLKKDILPICFLSTFQTFLQYLLLYIGIINVSGTKSSILTSVSAFGSVILSAVCFKNDNLTFKKIIGCIIGIIGIIIINFNGDGFSGFVFMGDGLVILSNASGAVGNIISKKISDENLSPIKISGFQLLFGGSALIIVGVLCGGNIVFYNFNCWLCLIYLAVMAGIAFMLWTMLLAYNSVSKVAVFNLLIPVFGTMWSGIFLRENIFTLINLISLLFVCSGIFLVNFKISNGDKK